MKQEDIIRMAREAGLRVGPSRDGPDDVWGTGSCLVRFAALLLASVDPQSSMAWQEGNEAGRLAEREACAQVCDAFNFGQAPQMIQRAIRARGQA